VTGLILASLALMGSPGPATISLAATGAAFGFSRGVPYLLGINVGTTCVLMTIALGVTGLVLAIPGVTPVLVTLAALYILYLAYKIATAAPLSTQSGTGSAPRMWNGLLLALANPKAYAAIGAVFSGFTLIESQPANDAIFKIAVLTFMIFMINSVWLGVGASLAQVFRSPSASRIINLGFSALLVISVIFSLLL
ncbi:MAG: LysE family translocator, partial [Rhizobiales bacterium]|nr:LysE family translocator [Hyphomicrobiales bacterium]